MSYLKCLRPELPQIWDGFGFWMFTYKLIEYLMASNIRTEVHLVSFDYEHFDYEPPYEVRFEIFYLCCHWHSKSF